SATWPFRIAACSSAVRSRVTASCPARRSNTCPGGACAGEGGPGGSPLHSRRHREGRKPRGRRLCGFLRRSVAASLSARRLSPCPLCQHGLYLLTLSLIRSAHPCPS